MSSVLRDSRRNFDQHAVYMQSSCRYQGFLPCIFCICLQNGRELEALQQPPVCYVLVLTLTAGLRCRPAILFLAFVLDAAFALAIIGFLVMHCRMIAKNLTTIEMYEKRRSATGHWPFDKGAKQNYLEVFGTR